MRRFLLVCVCGFMSSACVEDNPDYTVGVTPTPTADQSVPSSGGQMNGSMDLGVAASSDSQREIPPPPPDGSIPPTDAGSTNRDARRPANPNDVDGDGAPSDRDCDDNDPARYPGAAESCDNVDNDCDDRIDEAFERLGDVCSAGQGVCLFQGEVRCADNGRNTYCAGQQAEPSDERCDQLDNDCDGQVDEDINNCCEPGEVRPCGSDVGQCREGTKVCDGNGRFSACRDAILPGEERCSGRDEDCDGRADEAYQVGAGCQVERDGCILGEGVFECDEMGGQTCRVNTGPAQEVCNGEDDDCDGQVDEGDTPCVTYVGSVVGPEAQLGIGRDLIIVGDLNEDGAEEAMASGVNGDNGVVAAIDGLGERALWSHVDEGPLGFSLGVLGRDGAAADRFILAGAPRGERGAVHQFNSAGEEVEVYTGDDNFKLGESMATHPDFPGVVLGDSRYDDNRGGLLISIGDDSPFIAGSFRGERLGERIFLVPDLDEDGTPDILATGQADRGIGDGRGTTYFPSSNWDGRIGVLTPVIRDSTFAESLTWGNFWSPNELHFAYGTPSLDVIGRRNVGGVYMVDRGGQIFGSALRGENRDELVGRRLTTYRRPGENIDWLVVGGGAMGRIEFWKLRRNGFGPDIEQRIPITLENVTDSFGVSVAITRRTADGRSLMYVGEPNAGDRGKVHIFWIR